VEGGVVGSAVWVAYGVRAPADASIEKQIAIGSRRGEAASSNGSAPADPPAGLARAGRS
jgi:hypothetical protein